ncbi:MAG: DUF1257 domain-containing protein [Bacillota bacterium]
MSHYTMVKTQITDVSALEKAVKELGYELLRNTEPRGYYRGRTCDFVVRLRGPYDVGLVREKNGTYTLTADWWGGHVERELGKGAQRLLQEYGVQKTVLEARRKGYSVYRQQLQDGTVKLILRGF